MIPDCRPRVTVLTDLNMFDNGGVSANMLFAGQLLWTVEEPPSFRWYPSLFPSGPALFDRGRESPCWRDGSCGDSALSTLRNLYSEMAGAGRFDISSKSGTLTSVPTDVKLLFLRLPREVFTVVEISLLKRFVAAGGRIVFIVDRPDYYCAVGLETLPQFLADMGSGARGAPGAFDCGDYHVVPLGSLPPHRLTIGISSVRVRCTGAITTDVRDFILFRDVSGEHIPGASVSVNTTSITEHQEPAAGGG